MIAGETDIVRKRPDIDPFIISGTNILEGERYAISLLETAKKRSQPSQNVLADVLQFFQVSCWPRCFAFFWLSYCAPK